MTVVSLSVIDWLYDVRDSTTFFLICLWLLSVSVCLQLYARLSVCDSNLCLSVTVLFFCLKLLCVSIFSYCVSSVFVCLCLCLPVLQSFAYVIYLPFFVLSFFLVPGRRGMDGHDDSQGDPVEHSFGLFAACLEATQFEGDDSSFGLQDPR